MTASTMPAAISRISIIRRSLERALALAKWLEVYLGERKVTGFTRAAETKKASGTLTSGAAGHRPGCLWIVTLAVLGAKFLTTQC